MMPAATPRRLMPSGPWFLRGLRGSAGFSALILSLAFLGFGAFARDLGFALWQVVLMSLTAWALPSLVVFAAAIGHGATYVAAAIAVTLSAVRLLPMTVALMPMMARERLPQLWFYVASHFVAVTGYVEALLRLPKVPPEVRLSYFLGLGTGLMLLATSGGAIGYLAAATLPPLAAAGLLILSPLYFLLATMSAAALPADRFALGSGLVLGPIAHLVDPGLDLLWAGLIGGSFGYAVQRFVRRRT